MCYRGLLLPRSLRDWSHCSMVVCLGLEPPNNCYDRAIDSKLALSCYDDSGDIRRGPGHSGDNMHLFV